MDGLGTVMFGDVSIKILTNSDQLTVAQLTIPAGVTAKLHHHPHEEVNYVVQGSVDCLCGDTTLHLKEGDSAQVPSNFVHNLTCTSAKEAIIISIWTPSRKDFIAALKTAKTA
jgi:quercetin dioxygenase-like cupin family protein